VPTLLVAPKPPPPQPDEAAPRHHPAAALDASRGYYADGAYTAAPTLGPARPTPHAAAAAGQSAVDLDPQDAYYARLRLRFSLLRATLRCTPPAERIAALDDEHPISLPGGSKRAFATWRRLLASTEPVPAQLASLDQGSVLRLLGVVTKELKRGRGVGRRGGAWVWGLLGRCREVGECGSEEVAVLRELGKRAVWVRRGWGEEGVGKWGGAGAGAGALGGRDAEGEEEEGGSRIVEGGDGQGAGDEEEEGGSRIVEVGDAQDDDGVEQPVESRSSAPPGSLNVETNGESLIPDTSDANPAPLAEATLSGRLDAEIQAPEPTVHGSEPTDVGPPTEAKASDSDSDNDESDSIELPSAKERIRARLVESVDAVHDANDETSESEDVTLATLDMILTVVGEFYGQRDLLEFRDLWDEML